MTETRIESAVEKPEFHAPPKNLVVSGEFNRPLGELSLSSALIRHEAKPYYFTADVHLQAGSSDITPPRGVYRTHISYRECVDDEPANQSADVATWTDGDNAYAIREQSTLLRAHFVSMDIAKVIHSQISGTRFEDRYHFAYAFPSSSRVIEGWANSFDDEEREEFVGSFLDKRHNNKFAIVDREQHPLLFAKKALASDISYRARPLTDGHDFDFMERVLVDDATVAANQLKQSAQIPSEVDRNHDEFMRAWYATNKYAST